MRLPPLRAGIYEHYKGNLYQVLGYAHDANADTLGVVHTGSQFTGTEGEPLGERMVVVYFGLQLQEAHDGPRLAVRTVEDFLAYVDPSDGSAVPESVVEASQGSLRYVEQQGYVARFTYRGPAYSRGMADDE